MAKNFQISEVWIRHVMFLFVGPMISLFWTSGDVSPGFQRYGSLACFLACLILRFSASATPAVRIGVSMAAKPYVVFSLIIYIGTILCTFWTFICYI